MNNLKIGIIGLSEGNGHPYSWAAIFNGYHVDYMADCPYPVIPEYLAKQEFPRDAIPHARVTHIWTQDKQISRHVQQASNIDYVVDQMEDLIGEVDAVLLARDDPENHYDMSKPFLEAGLPIYIDKPLATNLIDARRMLDLQQYEGQLFSCSALRYAKEFRLTPELLDGIGKIKFVDATIPKSWTKYAVHIIEPVLGLIPERGKVEKVTNHGEGELHLTHTRWKNDINAIFKVMGTIKCPLSIRVFGDKGYKELIFKDTYAAFKQSLIAFLKSVRTKTVNIPREETLEIVEIIEKGTPQL